MSKSNLLLSTSSSVTRPSLWMRGWVATSRSTSSSSGSSSSSNNAAASTHMTAELETNPTSPTPHSYRRPPPMRPYPMTPRRSVPPHILKPPYALTGNIPVSHFPDRVLLHDTESIDKMREAARLARKILDFACSLVNESVTTDEIDEQVHLRILEEGAYPSPLNYAGFPKSLCTSINEVICHGIPDLRPLQFGDVVSLDVSCFYNGVHGDNCATVIVGDCQDEVGQAGCDWRGVPYKEDLNDQDAQRLQVARKLVEATRQSLHHAIEICRPGACLSDVGNAIHEVADAYGFDTVQKYRGHGISTEFHCPPFVKHFRNNDRMELRPGMIFTIEPMLTEWHRECEEWDDDWTVVTVDGGIAAQFEHTVLITDSGVEILTLPE